MRLFGSLLFIAILTGSPAYGAETSKTTLPESAVARNNQANVPSEITSETVYATSDGYTWVTRITDTKNKLVCFASFVLGGQGTAGAGTGVTCHPIN